MIKKINDEIGEKVWNNVTGCTAVSPGCDNCSAKYLAKIFQEKGYGKYKYGFRPTFHKNIIDAPRHSIIPARVIVNSMGDLFHPKIKDYQIRNVFLTMYETPKMEFILTTKRIERLANLSNTLNWGNNIWIGTSVETSDYLDRVDILRNIPAAVRFIAFEPLLGDVGELNLDRIDWVTVCAERGKDARPMDLNWARSIRDQCASANVPFFFRQKSSKKRATGRLLDGRLHRQLPKTGEYGA